MSADLYALLIGIDCYLFNELNDGRGTYRYNSLRGCVRDIAQVEQYLRDQVHVPQDHILKLTSTNVDAERPPEPEDRWPTYDHIFAAFDQVAASAQPGDQIYVHYAGHGGRARTKWPQIKGADGRDETLVPMDIGRSTARYVRDIEIAHALQKLADQGLIVTVVLDSCHSGGATRQAVDLSAVRGTHRVDLSDHAPGSAFTEDELAATWSRLTAGGTRNAKPGGGWMPSPENTVVLAACRPSESAHEFAFDGVNRNGALTYWLLDTLQDAAGPGLTYRMLHERILAKVHTQFQDQTPMLQGAGDRAVFGVDRVAARYATTVLQVEGDTLLLDAGQAQGLKKGALFALYAPGMVDDAEENRIALAEISKLGAASSNARITDRFTDQEIVEGAPAILVAPGSTKLVRQAALHPSLSHCPKQALRAALQASPWLEEGQPADYQIAADGDHTVILDRAGVPIPNLRPQIGENEPNSAARVISRLEHLVRYQAMLEIHNHNRRSPLANKLVVEWAGKQSEYDEADLAEPEPFDDPDDVPTVRDGEWAFLRVENRSDRVLNIAVLDMQPDWGVTQTYPWDAGERFIPIDPGGEEIFALNMFLPGGYTEGSDTFKVMATVEPANFRWMELPALDRPVARSAGVRHHAPDNPLEELMSVFTSAQPPSRNARPSAYPGRRWVTEQVAIRVHKTE